MEVDASGIDAQQSRVLFFTGRAGPLGCYPFHPSTTPHPREPFHLSFAGGCVTLPCSYKQTSDRESKTCRLLQGCAADAAPLPPDLKVLNCGALTSERHPLLAPVMAPPALISRHVLPTGRL